MHFKQHFSKNNMQNTEKILINVFIDPSTVRLCVCVCLCLSVCLYVYIHVCIYMHVCVYVYQHRKQNQRSDFRYRLRLPLLPALLDTIRYVSLLTFHGGDIECDHLAKPLLLHNSYI